MDDLVEEVRRAAGLRAQAHAAAALRAVLAPLGAMVPHRRRETVADALPEPLGEALRALPYDASRNAAWLVETVANQEHVRMSFGIEHVEAVLGVIRDALPGDVWRLLVSELPEDVRELVPAVRPSAPPVRRDAPQERPSRPVEGSAHRLAAGRPGSEHPVADSRPTPRAHSHSVARSDDPHGDAKLSEATGLTQERERESLAEALPGPEHPIGSTRPDD